MLIETPVDRAAQVELFRRLPLELRERDQWVVWLAVPRPGKLKPDKVPFQPYLKQRVPAKINDPRTWGSFGAAITVYELGRNPLYSGISYAITPDDRMTFVDLDNVRDPETAITQEWACDLLEELRATYIELSPSGTGLHALVKGRLPRDGRRRSVSGQLEMYDSGRFATMTGLAVEIDDGIR